jgi:hypothetical protein
VCEPKRGEIHRLKPTKKQKRDEHPTKQKRRVVEARNTMVVESTEK